MKNRRQRIKKLDDGLRKSIEWLRKFCDSIDNRIDSLKTKLKNEKKVSSEQKHLLNKLVGRFIAYDKSRDKFIAYLQLELGKTGVDYENLPAWERLHMDQDEKFCRVREICRIVKKDPNLLWC